MKRKWPYLLSFLKEHRWLVLGTLLAGLFANLFTVLIPVSIGKYYNLVFYFESRKAAVLDIFPEFFWDTVPHFIIFFATLVLLRIIFGFTERYLIGIIGEKLVYQIRGELFEHQLYMSMREYDERGIGRYLLRYSGDLKGVQNYLTRGIIRFASDVILLSIATVFLLVIDFWLFAILLVFMAITLYFVSVLNKRLYDYSEQHRGSKSGLLSFVNTRLRAILTIRVFNKQKGELRKYLQKSKRIYQKGVRYQFMFSLVQSAVPSLLYLMLAIIMVYVYLQNQSGGPVFNGGALLTSVLLLLTMMPVLRRVLRVTIKWKLGNLSINKLMNTFNKPQEENADKPDYEFREGKIEVRNLDFEYNGDNVVFSGLSMDIPSHQVAWIQGNLGSGKSTLIKLLMGIYPPTSGEIIIDDQPIDQFNPASLRQKMTIVSSDIPIYGKTVFEAVSRKHRKSSRKVIQRMLDKIQGHLPLHQRLSLDDTIGDLGVQLSKGQIKILSYVRAFITNKPIILIDEPFAGLDQRTSEIIARMIRKMKHKATILIFSKQAASKLGDFANILFIDSVFVLKRTGEKELKESFVEERNMDIGHSIVLDHVTITDSKGRGVVKDLSLELPGGQISTIIAPHRKQRTYLRRVLTVRREAEEGTLLLGDKEIDGNLDYGREMVSYGGPMVTLSGNTVLDAVTKSKDPLMREEAERMILVLQNNLPGEDRLLPDEELPDPESLNDLQRLILSTAKAIVSRKPVLVLEQPFDLLDESSRLVLARLLRREKTNRTVVIISRSDPTLDQDLKLILDSDKVIHLEDLLTDDDDSQQAG